MRSDSGTLSINAINFLRKEGVEGRSGRTEWKDGVEGRSGRRE